MTPEARMALERCIEAGVPVLLWGAPGTGKTAAVTAIASRVRPPVEVVIASIREPSDFGGLPVVAEGGVRLHPPAWARRLADAGQGTLFLDEISTAPPAVQAALLRVVLDRVVGDLPLPRDVSIVAAANPPEQAAGGWDLSPPLANRFVHLAWPVDATAWQSWMIGRGIPAYATVAAFIRARPHLLLQVPRDEAQAGRAWPSPRSWETAARLLGGPAEEILVAGAVGEAAALEFLAWRRDLDLPDPEALLADPGRYVHPGRGDRAFAVLAAVASAAVGNLTRPRWQAAWEILSLAAQAGGADVAAIAARSLAQARRPDLPLPVQQLQPFLPILRAAGAM